jgi:FAD dependent oxidoreductase
VAKLALCPEVNFRYRQIIMLKFLKNILKSKLLTTVFAGAFFATLTFGSAPSTGDEITPKNFDVVIYGGTPSAVAAAISASDAGHSALIVSDRSTIGGSISNGLGATDIRAKFAVTGIAREFFYKVQSFYDDSKMWNVEPHVAEQIFRNMLRGHDVKIVSNASLDSVDIKDDHITCINLHQTKKYCGQIFIDASYTSDLMNAAGVPSILGPSDLYAYGEPEAEFRHFKKIGYLRGVPESAVFNAMKNNPFVEKSLTIPQGKELLKNGTPSWTYRLCLSKKKMRPFKRSPDYDTLVPSWRVLVRAIHPKKTCLSNCILKSKKSRRASLITLAPLPNGKFDVNAGTSQISNLPIPREYFTKPETRRVTENRLRNYLESYLYFLQHDPTVPRANQQDLEGFGLCADEFVSNKNWPYAPYIREGRRLIGRSTLTTNHILRSRTTSEAIAIGSYSLDTKSSHLIYAKGAVYRDVGKFMNPSVYEIPYSDLVPGAGPKNILTSVNISASPTAFGSVRMEPQLLEIGQAAGAAAAIAIEKNIAVEAVSVSGLRTRLWRAGDVTSIKVLCKKLSPRQRIGWQFNQATCQPT